MTRKISSVDRPDVDSINSTLKSNLDGTVRWDDVKTVSCQTAGGVVIVPHDLGSVPNDIRVVPMINAEYWVDSSDLKLWSNQIITFHASLAGRYMVWAGVR